MLFNKKDMRKIGYKETKSRFPRVEWLEARALMAISTQSIVAVTPVPGATQAGTLPSAKIGDVDAAGNQYIFGEFENSVLLAGSLKVATSASHSQYVAKLDANGRPVWAVAIKPAAADNYPILNDVEVAGDGTVYLQIDNFDKNQRSYSLTTPVTPADPNAVPLVQNNSGDKDEIYTEIVKLDRSGRFVWNRAIRTLPDLEDSGNSYSSLKGTSLEVDGQGGVVISGEYGRGTSPDTGDYLPAPRGVRILGGKEFDLGYGAARFVMKLDANGAGLWATAVSGGDLTLGDGMLYPAGIAIDSAGDIGFVGALYGKKTIGGVEFSPRGGIETFLVYAKLRSSDGKISSPRRLGTFSWFGLYPSYLSVDRSGNLLVAGGFKGGATVGTNNLASVGGYDAYVAKFDADGKNLWAKSGGGPQDDYATGIATDGQGKTYVIGQFRGSATIAPASFVSRGGGDIFMLHYSPSGEQLNAQSDGSQGNDISRGIATAPNGLTVTTASIASGSGTSIGGVAFPAAGGGLVGRFRFAPATGSFTPLPAETHTNSIALRWSDSPAGAASSYDIYVSVDGGALAPWLIGTKLTSSSYPGVEGKRYGFAVVAIEPSGERSALPAAPQVSTLIRTQARISVVATSNLASINAGSPIQFVATVTTVDSWAGAPAGRVQFLVDGSPFGDPIAVSNGKATLPATTALAIGSREIMARFVGAPPFLSGTSSPILVQVIKPGDPGNNPGDPGTNPSDPGNPGINPGNPGVPIAMIRIEQASPVSKKGEVTALSVRFGGTPESGSAGSPASYRILTAGRDNKLGTKDDKTVPIARATYDAKSNSVIITPRRKFSRTVAYRLVILASPNGIRDHTGRAIDGNGDGTPGGDAIFTLKRGRVTRV